METPTHSVTMSAFFALPEVVALQEFQKANPYGSAAHRKAFDDMKALAATFGVAEYLGDY